MQTTTVQNTSTSAPTFWIKWLTYTTEFTMLFGLFMVLAPGLTQQAFNQRRQGNMQYDRNICVGLVCARHRIFAVQRLLAKRRFEHQLCVAVCSGFAGVAQTLPIRA